MKVLCAKVGNMHIQSVYLKKKVVLKVEADIDRIDVSTSQVKMDARQSAG